MFQCEKGIKQGGERKREREIEGKKNFFNPRSFFYSKLGKNNCLESANNENRELTDEEENG